MKVGIIGGGIAGLSAALALQKAGIDFHLFEQSDAFREVGAGIMLSSSTRHLLEQLGVLADFDAHSTPIHQFVITNHRLEKIKSIPNNHVGYSIHRAKLVEVLSKPLHPSNYTFQARIERLIPHAQSVELIHDGQSYFFDAIIAADGIHSATRKQLIPLVQPRFTQQTIWRGMSRIALPNNFQHAMHEMWGKNLRFGMLHKTGDQYFWYAIKWAKEGEKDQPNTLKQDLQHLFAAYHPTVHELIASGEHIIRTDLKDILPGNFSWHNGRVAFIGDAIHACTPHISQGACQAIESAYTVVACLKKHAPYVHEAFTAYEHKRKPKTNFITHASYQFGRFNHQRKDWQDNALHKAMKVVPRAYLAYNFNKTVDLKYLKDLPL